MLRKTYHLLMLLPLAAPAQTIGVTDNMVMTTTYRVPTTTPILIPEAEQASVNVTYLDGIGRPVQKIARRQSGTGGNIVTHIEYDALGRQTKEYLPYPSGNSMHFYEPGARNSTLSYYSGQYGSNIAYSEKVIEGSPAGRVLKQGAPGDEWQVLPGSAADHSVKMQYGFNAQDEVKLFGVQASYSPEFGIYGAFLAQGGYWPADQLHKTVTKDENWTSGSDHTVEEFKDKRGRVVLKRTYDRETPHDTYYAYDQFGNLSFVIPPLASKNASISQSMLDNLGYQYRYDRRNRLAEKKLPGKQWEYIVYDRLDRPVATGPANSPFGAAAQGWVATKYDALGRPAYTGFFTGIAPGSAGRKQYQDIADAAPVLFEAKTQTAIGIVTVGYGNAVYPTSIEVLTASYYDDYAFPGAPAIPTSVEGEPVSLKTRGLATGSYTRVLDSPTSGLSEKTYTLYDKKGRVIRTYLLNHLGGFTQVDSRLHFDGSPEYIVTTHRRTAGGKGSASKEYVFKDRFTYTPQGRVDEHTHSIYGDPEELLSKSEYDELGQLVFKNVGNTLGSAPLQQVGYQYNIRGWLKAINDVDSLGDDFFAFKINYETVENMLQGRVSPLYNGNISETFWKTSTDGVLRKYGYGYDAMNRLRDAQYQKPNEGTASPLSYNESMAYDANGNITSLSRYGDLDRPDFAIQIDDLSYGYDDGNRLKKVTDHSGHPAGFKDGADLPEEYLYDDHGNMLSDANKGIASISYNHLNLPVKLTFGNGGTIDYLYDASGVKLEKKVNEGGAVSTIDYLTGFHYRNTIFEFFPTAEGYIKWTAIRGGGAFNYVYNYTDHLGNVRLSYGIDFFTGGTQILEESHYYPFGMKHAKYNADVYEFVEMEGSEGYYVGIDMLPPNTNPSYNYKYNGKEFQDELGLNLYDYGARNYDPAIGRWMNIDPLAENSRRWTPYNYGYNNPIFFVDPDGMQSNKFGEKAEKVAQENEKKLDEKINELNKGKASDKKKRIAQLNKSKKDISDMRKDEENEYIFESASGNNGNPETKRTGENEITIFTDDFSEQVHESRHGGQIARGEYDIDMNGAVVKGTYGVSKEVDAYQAQFGYDGKIDYRSNVPISDADAFKAFKARKDPTISTINSFKQINPNTINTMIDFGGIPIYPPPTMSIKDWNQN